MYKQVCLGVASLVGGVLLSATTVHAQQSIVLNAGYFAPRGEATRVLDDVLVENLSVFAFDVKDFNGGTVGGEWIIGIGDYFDAGIGVGFYQRTGRGIPGLEALLPESIQAAGCDIAQVEHRRAQTPNGLRATNEGRKQTNHLVDGRVHVIRKPGAQQRIKNSVGRRDDERRPVQTGARAALGHEELFSRGVVDHTELHAPINLERQGAAEDG